MRTAPEKSTRLLTPDSTARDKTTCHDGAGIPAWVFPSSLQLMDWRHTTCIRCHEGETTGSSYPGACPPSLPPPFPTVVRMEGAGSGVRRRRGCRGRSSKVRHAGLEWGADTVPIVGRKCACACCLRSMIYIYKAPAAWPLECSRVAALRARVIASALFYLIPAFSHHR